MHLKILSLSVFAFFSSISSAHAYLDPGTGSSLLQMLIALLAVAGATIKIYWAKLKNFFGKLVSSKKNKKNP